MKNKNLKNLSKKFKIENFVKYPLTIFFVSPIPIGAKNNRQKSADRRYLYTNYMLRKITSFLKLN
mgnify:CR=1 FL=1